MILKLETYRKDNPDITIQESDKGKITIIMLKKYLEIMKNAQIKCLYSNKKKINN